MRRSFWLVIAMIAVLCLILIFNHDQGMTFGYDNDVFAQAGYLAILGIVIGAGVLGSGIKLSDMARNIAVWALIVLFLVAGYQYRYELQDIGSRITVGLIPASPISSFDSDGNYTVRIEKSADGHFHINATVNGHKTSFLVDTGASSVVLSSQAASQAGFDVDQLNFSIPIQTANGKAFAAPISIGVLKVGNIERYNMRALVTQDGSMDGSLLGMSFLNSLQGFSVRSDQLILID